MLKAGQLHSCRPPAGPLEAVNTHLSETRNSANRDDLVKIILPSLLTEVLFKAHPARILWSSCPQQSSGPQSFKYSFFPVSPPFSPPLILSYPHGKQFFTTVKENTFLTLCLPQAIPPSLTEKKKSWKSKYVLFFGIVHPSFTFQTIAIWPQQTLDATFTKVNNGFLSTSPTDSFHSSLYEPPCNACHGWLLTILKFCYFPNSIAGLSPCFYSHL